MLGLNEKTGHMAHAAWVARIHEDDRPVYEQALGDYRGQAGLAFRIEFRVRDQKGHYR